MASAARWRRISAIATDDVLIHLPAAVSRQCAVVFGLCGVWADCALAISPRFSASGFWDEIRATGATQFNALGAMTNIILKTPPSPRDREHRVRQAMIVPLSPETYRAVSTRFGVQVTRSTP